MWSSPDVVGLFSNNVVSFSRNVVLRDHLFSVNLVSKPRMLSVRGDYVLSSLHVARGHMNGAGVSTVHGGDQVHGLIPLRADALEIDVGEADGAHGVGNFGTARQEQVTALERFQARTQREAEHLGQGHGEVGIAGGVD